MSSIFFLDHNTNEVEQLGIQRLFNNLVQIYIPWVG